MAVTPSCDPHFVLLHFPPLGTAVRFLQEAGGIQVNEIGKIVRYIRTAGTAGPDDQIEVLVDNELVIVARTALDEV